MPSLDDLENGDSLRGLSWFVALSQAVGITMVVLVGVWLQSDLGGFGWDGGAKEFNLHPVCMVCGMVFLFGESAIVYRVFRNSPKRTVKIIHTVLHSLVILTMIIGLVAVFDFHNHNNIANMYSLHSWCGMATVIFFCLQYILGFLIFLFPGAAGNLRTIYLPHHRFFGGALLVFAAITCISGINEKLFFVLKGAGYQLLPGKALLGNMCGLVIVAFVTIILFILQRDDWRRKSRDEHSDERVTFAFRRQPISTSTDDEE